MNKKSNENSLDGPPIPEIKNSNENPIKTSIPSLNAEKIGKHVEINAQILGEVKHKALPGRVEIFCVNCDEKVEVDIRNDREIMEELIFSKKRTKTILSPLLSGKCQETKDMEGNHLLDFRVLDHIDYSLLQIRDVLQHDAKYNIQDYKPKWVHLVNCEIPDAKKIAINGIVVYDDTPQKRNIELISDMAKPLEDELAQFQITEQDKKDFTECFESIPINQIAPGMIGRDYVRESMLLLLHSPAYIPDIHRKGSLQRGLLRMIFLGDSKTNKSTSAKDLTPLNMGGHYPFGEFVSAETGSRTGILYTIDNDKKALSWGSLVLNDMGLVILDGMHSLHSEEVKGMREVLEQLIVVVRRSVSGDALARTRIIGIINPKKTMNQYLRACQAITDTWVFKDPVDITRWDLFLPFKNEDVDFDEIIKAEPEDRPIPDEILTRHVYWAWSRKPEQIIYPKNIKEELINAYHELDKYRNSELPLVHPAIKYVILRLAVAYACLLHSTNDAHDKVIVKAKHVKMATKLLKTTYEQWELAEYIEEREGKNIDQGFLDIIKNLDDIAINILLKLQEDPKSIRGLAQEFEVSKKVVELRYTALKDLNLIDTTKRPVMVTPYGVKLSRQVLELNRQYRMSLSPDPLLGDKLCKNDMDHTDLSPEKGSRDTSHISLTSFSESDIKQNGSEDYYDAMSDEELRQLAYAGDQTANEVYELRILQSKKFKEGE